MPPLTLLSAILFASSAVPAWATSSEECEQEQVGLLQTRVSVPGLNRSDLRAAPLTDNSSVNEPRAETALSEKHVGKDKTLGVDVCSAVTLPSDCSCTKVDHYTSKLTCSKAIEGPTGSNTFTLAAVIKPCLGPPTIALTASEKNTGHSFQKSITTSDETVGVGVPGLSVDIGVAAVGMKLIATINDLGNDRFAVSFALDACSSVGSWWSPAEVCGSSLSSALPKTLFNSPMLNFYSACAGTTADDGAPVMIWNYATGRCLVTTGDNGYAFAAGCSNQESVWTWTKEHAFKTKSGKCLDTYVASDGHTYVKAGACIGNLNQKWDWSGDKLINRATRKCLGIHQASVPAWADIAMQDCADPWTWVWSVA